MEKTVLFPRKLGRELATMLLLLVVLFGGLLHGVFEPGQTLASNDGPLGELMTQCHQLPERFTGCWDDLNNVGFNVGAAPPGISLAMQWLLRPVLFSKLYALVSLVILGLGAWCYFVNLRLAPVACLLGGLAAALNSTFFSVACWGVAAQTITAGMIFFALAALADDTSRLRWWRAGLAGLAVGMAVIEGADVGALFSLFVAVWVVFQAWIGSGSLTQRLFAGFSRVAVVALCAGSTAAPTVFSLVNTEIKGVVVGQFDNQTKQARWDWATQWSLPAGETTGLLVSGLFGYRMDTPDGGCYWGQVGEDPAVERYLANGRQGDPPHGFLRYSGGGFYTGVLVVLLACWAMGESLRRRFSVFNPAQRLWLWFWLGVVVVSIPLAFGRFAPFYRLAYALPYFSTIRNPVKFMTFACFALVVMFAYGVDGLWRKYMLPPASGIVPWRAGFRGWWRNAGPNERKWLRSFGLVLGFSLMAWLMYAADRQKLVDHLIDVQFTAADAEQITAFSILQVGWFVLFFVLSAGLLFAIFGGAFTGAKARWGGLLLGVLLVADLGRANLPWIVCWNYPEKYASNPVLDRLRDQPYEHRVGHFYDTRPDSDSLTGMYNDVWLQQLFPYYNIQSFDVVSMPRMPADLKAYLEAQSASGLKSFIRMWQLTNTRYVIGAADLLESLNDGVARADEKFRIVERFDLVPKPGTASGVNPDNLTAVPDANGSCALFEFAGALPRAKLYANWQINPDDAAVLERLASPNFDPLDTLLVAGGVPAASNPSGQPTHAGTVEYASYAPRNIRLKTEAPAATVLLLNDHYDPLWRVLVDGRPSTLLRCNYIMRGVYLPAGNHTVEFQFNPPYRLIYLTLGMVGLGLLILPLVIFAGRNQAVKKT